MHLAAYLELLGKPYTGADPHALYLAQDKSLAKKLFAFHGIRTPAFAVSHDGETAAARAIGFPLIVKPIAEDGSIGIEADSVVRDVKALKRRIARVREECGSPALIERYVEGREIYAAFLGEATPEALPLVEMDLSGLPRGVPRIASGQVKWAKGTRIYRSVRSRVVEDLDTALVRRIQSRALEAYRAVKLRDYGRIDIRLTPEGEAWVIEANPNPWLSSGAEFAMAARASGRTYVEMLRDIVSLAMTRYA
jgi:D-alanine-D-alanine ligase